MNEPADAVVVVLCTAPGEKDGAPVADALAHRLVDERLCACVNLLPVRSVYRWHGAVEQGSEVLLVCKTTAGRAAALQARIRELHPYELPEILELETAGGLPAYVAWVGDSVRPADEVGS